MLEHLLNSNELWLTLFEVSDPRKACRLGDLYAEIAKNNINVKIDFENADKAVEAMRAEGQKYLKDSLGF